MKTAEHVYTDWTVLDQAKCMHSVYGNAITKIEKSMLGKNVGFFLQTKLNVHKIHSCAAWTKQGHVYTHSQWVKWAGVFARYANLAFVEHSDGETRMQPLIIQMFHP